MTDSIRSSADYCPASNDSIGRCTLWPDHAAGEHMTAHGETFPRTSLV